MKQSAITLAALVLLPAALAAQNQPLPVKLAARPTTGAITPADLMSRVYLFADDSMMGRRAGTIYHDKGTDYIARELQRLGLTPAGEGGTFFQRLPLVERVLAAGTKLTVNGRAFEAWRDFLPRDNGPTARAMQESPVVYGGVFGVRASMIAPDQVAGKVVVFTVQSGWSANRGMLVQQYIGAAAIVVATLDSMPADVKNALAEPSPMMKGAADGMPPLPSFFYTTGAMTEALLGAPVRGLRTGAAGRTATGAFDFVERDAPGARNVVAIVPGGDRSLAGQYVAIGAHSDHVGVGEAVDHDSLYAFYHVVRPNGADDGDKPAADDDWPKVRSLLDSLRRAHQPRADSIFNGADDDASGSMALLEVAEALASSPNKPKRSILLVWHVAEEQGLLGAQHFTDNPTVPRDSIVAQINIDMIGRGGAADLPGGGAGYLQLIGARRLSSELGDIVEAEGKRFNPPFRFDYQYDANGHPQQFYCRSDHYMYARYGIPVVFMSTGGHAEYHQVTDEPQYINYDQLTRVSQLVLQTATSVANLDHRLVVDKPKPDPNGQCVQ